MGVMNRIRPWHGLFTLLISLILCGPAFCYDNPDLLPENYTPVIDLAKTLSTRQKVQLEKSLDNYETENVLPNYYLLSFYDEKVCQKA